MSKHQVLVSVSTPQSFQSTESWKQFYLALLSQLPLRNIHWKSASRPTIRTIQELDVSLLPLETVQDEHTSQIPVSILEKPFLNMYVVACEDIDVDTYRTVIKRQIKEWHNAITMRKNQEWLILHIVKPDARMPTGNFFQLKGSVLDRIKADFNMDKRDRCVQLAWSQGYDNPTAWAEVINKIKDGILFAFDSAVAQREDEVKRSESQRQMPGWNFCTFFILKESLASSFEGVNLFEDALLQYDELETSFSQVLKEKNLSWFGTFISPASRDDSLPLLSITKKPYRDLILANTISIFDFRIYLLARQCSLLGNLGRIAEITKKVSAFLGAFGKKLRGVEVPIPVFFVESWTYSSVLSVVEQCNSWAADFTLEESSLASFNAGKGELFELARNQLDIIGVSVGYLPSKTPFSLHHSPGLTPPNTSWKDSSPTISNPDLLASLGDRDIFYDLYVKVTNHSIDMYAKGRRRKFALKLHGSLAALDVHRGRLAAALATFTSLPAHYSPHMWTSLESYMLSRALDTHKDLNKSRDRDWISILLAFLKTCVENQGVDMLIHETDRTSHIRKLVEALQVAASQLDTNFVHPDHPAISMQISNEATLSENQDSLFLSVTVMNFLPCSLPIDEISVQLVGPDAERLKFTLRTETLATGKTALVLSCPTSSSGIFVLDSSEVCMSRLQLRWSHRRLSHSGNTSRAFRDHAILVRIPHDLHALDVRLQQPKCIELGGAPKVLVVLSTGRNNVSRVTLRLQSLGINFVYQDVAFENCDLPNFEVANDRITLKDLTMDSNVPILVPHSDVSAFKTLKVSVEIEYNTVSEPSIIRTLRFQRVMVTTLPIAVNVEDFFRGKRLFSKFTISTTDHQHIRIASVQLYAPTEGSNGANIINCVSTKRGVVTVTPPQPVNFLFYLDADDAQKVHQTLCLSIRYRMLREEVESLVKASVEIAMNDSLTPSLCHVIVNKIIGDLEKDTKWVEIYSITGDLHVTDLDCLSGDLQKAFNQVKQMLHKNNHLGLLKGSWREIRIPVDIPQMNIVAATRLSILPATQHVYAGQPVAATLTIHSSFHWGSGAGDSKLSYRMRFDVQEMVEDWLVSGRKRGDFLSMDGTTYSAPITLIALRHGELTLPKVAIRTLREPNVGPTVVLSIETYQVHGAEKVLVLPRGGRSTFIVEMGGP